MALTPNILDQAAGGIEMEECEPGETFLGDESHLGQELAEGGPGGLLLLSCGQSALFKTRWIHLGLQTWIYHSPLKSQHFSGELLCNLSIWTKKDLEDVELGGEGSWRLEVEGRCVHCAASMLYHFQFLHRGQRHISPICINNKTKYSQRFPLSVYT